MTARPVKAGHAEYRYLRPRTVHLPSLSARRSAARRAFFPTYLVTCRDAVHRRDASPPLTCRRVTGARWAATGPAWSITRPGSWSPKARSGLIWQALCAACPGVRPARRGSLSCCPGRRWTSRFTAGVLAMPFRFETPPRWYCSPRPDWRGMAPGAGRQGGSYLVICCRSAVASGGTNGLGMFPQLEHHFSGVRIPADVTGCLSVGRRSIARRLRYFPQVRGGLCAPGRTRTCDPLLRRSFHARGHAAAFLITAGSPVVRQQLNVSGFRPVLARTWHAPQLPLGVLLMTSLEDRWGHSPLNQASYHQGLCRLGQP